MEEDEAIWIEYDQTKKELIEEILLFDEHLKSDDSQAYRRSYCRSVMTYIEALSSWMGKYTIDNYYPGMLSKKEKKLLQRRNNALERLFNCIDLFTDTNGALTPFNEESEE